MEVFEFCIVFFYFETGQTHSCFIRRGLLLILSLFACDEQKYMASRQQAAVAISRLDLTMILELYYV